MINRSKNPKRSFFMHLEADAEVCVMNKGAKDTPLRQLFLCILYLCDSIFPGIILIDKLLDFKEGICFASNRFHGNRKKTNVSSKT